MLLKGVAQPPSPGLKKVKLINPAGLSLLQIWKTRKEKVTHISFCFHKERFSSDRGTKGTYVKQVKGVEQDLF